MLYYHKDAAKAVEEARRELRLRNVIRDANLSDSESDKLRKDFADAVAKLRRTA